MEALASLGQLLLTIVVGLLILTVLVYVHELGHYLFAKWCGMRVNAFAIFMGGVRKTDLYKWLDKPLLPVKFVWGAFALSVGVAILGAFLQSNAVYVAGLALAGVAVPLWAILRLAALYHVPVRQVAMTWVKAMVVGALVLVLGTKLRGVDANMVVGVASGATLIALAIVYYLPIQMRQQEDDKQGYGQVEVKCGVDGALDKLPVRYRPVLSRVAKDGTEFSLLLLPLGGFASIAGMHPKADASETKIPGGFFSKPAWQRLLVLFAGPLFSILFGVLLLFGLYATIGKEVPDNRPIVDLVPEGTAAHAAGIKSGDVVVSIDGQAVRTFFDITTLAKDNWREVDGEKVGVPTEVVVRRDGELKTFVFAPNVDDQEEPVRRPDLSFSPSEFQFHARLGVLYGQTMQRYSLGAAVVEAFREPVRMSSDLAASLSQLFSKPSRTARNVAGPTGMAQVTSAAVQQGPYTVVTFAALLSLSLGVMNLLPIVPLDGGQMVVAFVELLRGGRRLSIDVQNWLANSGLALLVILMLAVWAVDLGRNAKANQRAEEPAKASNESK